MKGGDAFGTVIGDDQFKTFNLNSYGYPTNGSVSGITNFERR